MVSERTRRIGLSPTLRINALAGEMRARGLDILDFSAGEPDFPTPETIKLAGSRAIESNRTRYTANSGIIELREALARTILADHGVEYSPEEILVSPGAKASLCFACLALLDPADEVLLPAPYWVSYPEQIGLADGVAVVVPTGEESGFKLTAEQLEAHVTERTRMVILNYPSNPTGACYDHDELVGLAEWCVGRDLWILADEIYSKLLFDERRFTSIASLGPEVRARTLVIDGMSKTYSMTGWRVGYAAGPREVIAGMSRIQSHTTSNATSISQWASLEALELDPAELRRRCAEFQRRRDTMVGRLREIDGFGCVVPEGAFYAFPNVSGRFGRDPGRAASGEELSRFLLEQARVAVVPGEAFGSPSHVRFSFAASTARITEGMDRIEQALGSAG